MSIDIHPGEEMRDIPGLDGRYSATSTGRVFSHNYRRTGRTVELAQSVHPEGYRRVKLFAFNRNSPTPVHRVVAMAFHANPLNLPQVNHIDGDKANNRVENLEWVDNAGNQKHASRTGLHEPLTGEDHPAAIINDDLAALVKRDLMGEKYKGQITDIADRYGISKHIVFDIKRGKTWRHVHVS
jgi:hypothetical protein